MAGNSTSTSATNDNGSGGDLEINVLMEGDEVHSRDAEDGLACCAHKQAAGTLKEYKDNGQQLPEDGGYGSKEDEDEFTNKDIDIIYDAEWFALQKDEVVSDPEDDSEDDSKDDSEGNDATSNSSDEYDEDNEDHIPPLIPKMDMRNAYKGSRSQSSMHGWLYSNAQSRAHTIQM